MGQRYCDCFCFECSHIAHSDDNISVSTEEKDDLFKTQTVRTVHSLLPSLLLVGQLMVHGVVSHMNELYNINGASITKCSPPDVVTNSDSVPQDTVEDSDNGHSCQLKSVIAHCSKKKFTPNLIEYHKILCTMCNALIQIA